MEFNYPLDMTRTQAFTRRADKFMDWLKREEYNTYTGPESMVNLVRLIRIIQEAFNTSMTKDDWEPFYLLFRECRLQAQDIYETEEARKVNFDQVIILLSDTLQQYKDYIPEHVLG